MTDDLRNTLVEEYGVSNSETGEIEITDEELFNKKYEEEFNKLLRIETILPIEKFNIEELIEIGIKSSDLVPLLPLIEPSEEEN